MNVYEGLRTWGIVCERLGHLPQVVVSILDALEVQDSIPDEASSLVFCGTFPLKCVLVILPVTESDSSLIRPWQRVRWDRRNESHTHSSSLTFTSLEIQGIIPVGVVARSFLVNIPLNKPVVKALKVTLL